MRKSLPFLFFFCCLFLVWEATLWQHPTWTSILPSPILVFKRLYFGYDRFLLHSMATFEKILGGLFLSLVVAFPLAWLMTSSKSIRLWLQPFIVLMQGMPMFALAPLMVLLFDWSYTAVIVPTALMIFFPLTVSIYRGFDSTPQSLLDYFRIHRATPFQLFFSLQLPWAMPHICSGLRISGAIAAMSAFTGEWAGAQEGLGVLMMESRRGGDLETTFAALVCLSAISMTLYGCMAGFEFLILSSRRSSRSWVNALFSFKRQPASAYAAILVCLVLAGCAKNSSNEPTVRLMLDWNPNPNHIPLYAGIEKGFFKEEGLPLQILKIHDPADTFPYLASGQADIGINYMPHYLRNYKEGQELIPIGYLIKHPLNSLIFSKSLNVKSIQDLNGLVFGRSHDDLLARSLSLLLSKHQVAPGKTQKVGFNLVTALASGKVDVLYGVYANIEGEQLRAFGVETDYFTMEHLGMAPYFELLFLTSKHSIYAQPAKIAAFKRALDRSIQFSKENPEEAFAFYLKAHPDKSPSAQNWEKRSWLTTATLLAETQDDEPEIWSQFIDWLHENTLIDRKIALQEIFP